MPEQAGQASAGEEDDGLPGSYCALADFIDETGEGAGGIDGVEDKTLSAGGGDERVERRAE